MQNITTYIRLSMLVCFLLVMTPQLWAAPGFELDLKELKKPSPPPPAVVKKKVITTEKKKQIAPPQKKVQLAKKKKPVPTKQVATETAPQPVSPSELALKGGDACQLAERMAIAVAQSVPVEPALNGLHLKPVVAVKSGDLTAVITCGISPAEAYTFARLLEEHQIYLLNIGGNETTAEVARKVIDILALSYMRENEESAKEGELIYLFPAGEERRRPLRLTLQP
jgi:hypothetical protein